MLKLKGIMKPATSVLFLAGTLGWVSTSNVAVGAEAASAVEQGKEIAFDRAKGNCLACHQIEGGELPGNIGPPLVAMKARFPDKAKLRSQIADATKMNPNSIMPPFGRNQILSESEIDKVVEFIYTL